MSLIRQIAGIGVSLGLAATALGAAPTTVEGTIFRTSGHLTRFLFLETTGKASDLIGGSLEFPYTYEQTSVSSGILRILSETSPTAYYLAFSSDTAGTAMAKLITSTLLPVTVNFTLVPARASVVTPMINASLRGTVTPGHPLIAGFVIPGNAGDPAREFVVRVAGPALKQFGLRSPWATPDLEIYRGSAKIEPNNFPVNWPSQSPRSAKASKIVGAFPFAEGSNDASLVVRLSPGPYTIIAAAKPGDPGGDALIEIYAIP